MDKTKRAVLGTNHKCVMHFWEKSVSKRFWNTDDKKEENMLYYRNKLASPMMPQMWSSWFMSCQAKKEQYKGMTPLYHYYKKTLILWVKSKETNKLKEWKWEY